MGGKIQSGPKRYDCILIFFVIMLVGTAAFVFIFPEQVIIDVVSGLVEVAVIMVVFTVFKFMFPRDKSNRQRVRGGPYGSVYIAQNMYCFAVAGAVLILIFYHFLIHPGVISSIAEYVHQAGQLSGIAVVCGAMLLVMIMGYQIMQSFNY